jgi:hypothetical protein
VTTGARAAGHAWRQDMSAAAKPRARLSRGGLRWALTALVRQHLTVAKIAGGLGVSWNTADDAVLAEGRRVLISDPHRFDGAKVVGVDEHIWRHTRCGDKYVTVIIDLTPVRDRTGPARLLDMVEGRSKQVFKTWLAERDETWRAAVEVVALHGFTGFKTAAVEELGGGVTVVVDPFHVVRLGGECLELCRRRVQQQTRGHRGRAGDLLYSARRTLSTGADLLTDKQRQRISALFADGAHVQVEATWGVYQAMAAVAATGRTTSPHGSKPRMTMTPNESTDGSNTALPEYRHVARHQSSPQMSAVTGNSCHPQPAPATPRTGHCSPTGAPPPTAPRYQRTGPRSPRSPPAAPARRRPCGGGWRRSPIITAPPVTHDRRPSSDRAARIALAGADRYRSRWRFCCGCCRPTAGPPGC